MDYLELFSFSKATNAHRTTAESYHVDAYNCWLNIRTGNLPVKNPVPIILSISIGSLVADVNHINQ